MDLLKRSPGSDLLSQRLLASIIGEEELNFRVRNGIGCDLFSMAARANMLLYERNIENRDEVVLNLKKDSRTISTGQLNVSLRLHIRPINQVVYLGSLGSNDQGELILRLASRLDAFSGYPFRT